jgi:tRNA 2-thiouridine synthesizing protein C
LTRLDISLDVQEAYWMGKSVAVLMRKAPYGSVYTAEGFRTLMGIAVFEMDITVIYCDDGVYALLQSQDPSDLDIKPLGEGFPMLSEFGVSRFYVHDQALAERGLSVDDLVMPVEVVDGARIAAALEEAQLVLPF